MTEVRFACHFEQSEESISKLDMKHKNKSHRLQTNQQNNISNDFSQ